jgi:deoxyribonuclease-4
MTSATSSEGGPPGRPSRPVGAHVRVARGLTSGLREARQLGAEAVQVFTANPRGWALPAGSPAEDGAFRQQSAAAGLPVFVHAPYLINVASPDRVVWERSVISLRHSLARGAAIGAAGVVVHTGSAVGASRDAGLRRAREALLPLLDSLSDPGPDLLLEPMAGQGRMLCGKLDGLEQYLAALGWHPRAGVCLDTCHLFAAGHDLAAPGAAAALLAEFTRLAGQAPAVARATGAGRLRLIHANDSKDGCGSRRDRHENIGAGQIGTELFAGLLAHPATAGVPFITETPGPLSAHAADVALLKRLREAPAGGYCDGPSPGPSW